MQSIVVCSQLLLVVFNAVALDGQSEKQGNVEGLIYYIVSTSGSGTVGLTRVKSRSRRVGYMRVELVETV